MIEIEMSMLNIRSDSLKIIFGMCVFIFVSCGFLSPETFAGEIESGISEVDIQKQVDDNLDNPNSPDKENLIEATDIDSIKAVSEKRIREGETLHSMEIDSLITKIGDTRKEVQKSLENYLTKWPSSDKDGRLRFYLAELYREESNENYEKEFELFDSGKADNPPVVDYSPSIRLYRDIISEVDSSSFIPPETEAAVLYHLGCCLAAENELEEAVDLWQTLGEKFPKNKYAAEAWMRTGEAYFDQYKFDDAASAYKHVLDYWDSIYFDKALYKLGWVSYLEDKYDDAIGYFIYLLNDAEKTRLEEEKSGDVKKRGGLSLVKEAKEYAALSFIEKGGVEVFRVFVGNAGDHDYLPEILELMGNFYEKRGWYEAAIEAYDAYGELYPLNIKGPEVRLASIKVHEMIEDYEGSMVSREALALSYGAGSEWATVNGGSDEAARISQVTASALYDAARYFHKEGKEGNNSESLLRALDDYDKLLKAYPDFEKKYEALYAMADCYYLVGEYDNAAETYMKVAIVNDESDSLRSLAALNGIVSAEKALESSPAGVDSLALDRLMNDCNYFIENFPESPKEPAIRFKRGELYFSMGVYDSSIVDFSYVIDAPDKDLSQKAVRMLAKARYQTGNYEEAEKWFEKASGFGDPGTRNDMKNMALVSMYKQAETAIEKGLLDKAAGIYEKISETQTNSTDAAKALFKAAVLYSAGADSVAGSNPDSSEILTAKAAKTFEKTAEIFKGDEKAPKALYNAAILREKLEQFVSAAEDYRKLTREYPSSEFNEDAAFMMALDLEKAGKKDEAFTAFRTFAKTRTNPNYLLESYLKMVRGFMDKGKLSKANYYVIQTYRLNKEYESSDTKLDESILSEIFYLGATITSKRFMAVKLKEPLQQNLKKKEKLLNTLVKEYIASASLKIAPWTLAATYGMGEAFEHYHESLLNSEIPSGLSPEEQDMYIIELEDAAEPFIGKAVQAYASVVKQSDALGVDSEWKTKALAKLKVLDSEIYASVIADETNQGEITFSETDSTSTASGDSIDGVLVEAGTNDMKNNYDSNSKNSEYDDSEDTGKLLTTIDSESGMPTERILLFGGAGAAIASVYAFAGMDNGTTPGIAFAAASVAALGAWGYLHYQKKDDFSEQKEGQDNVTWKLIPRVGNECLNEKTFTAMEISICFRLP